MEDYHLEALEDNDMRDAEHMETIRLMHRQETRSGDPTDAGINKKGDFNEYVEINDEIPF